MVAFSEVLEYLENHEWVLYRINLPYRTFYKHGDPSRGLPILVEVHDGLVDDDDFEGIQRVVEEGDSKDAGKK